MLNQLYLLFFLLIYTIYQPKQVSWRLFTWFFTARRQNYTLFPITLITFVFLNKLIINILHIAWPFMFFILQAFHSKILIMLFLWMQIKCWITIIWLCTETYIKLSLHCCLFRIWMNTRRSRILFYLLH